MVDVTDADSSLREWIIRRDGDLRHMAGHLDGLFARHRIGATAALQAQLAERDAEIEEYRADLQDFRSKVCAIYEARGNEDFDGIMAAIDAAFDLATKSALTEAHRTQNDTQESRDGV